MYYRDTYPVSTFLGINRCLDVAVVEAYRSVCGPFGVQSRSVVRGAGAQSAAMV